MKEERIEFRASAEEREKMQAAADLGGLTLSAWLRMVSLAEARRATLVSVVDPFSQMTEYLAEK